MSGEFQSEALHGYPLPTDKLPPGWQCVALGDIALSINPGFASGKHSSDGSGIPHLRPMNVDRDGKIDLTIIKSVSGTEGIELTAGDVLFNNTNSPELVGKTALASSREAGYAYSNHMTRIRLEGGVVPSYVAAHLHFLWLTGYSKQRCTNHVNQASVSSQTLAKTFPFLLPPSNEQTRIVEKLEELLTDLDAGVAELKAAQRKLAHYRQSLLKAAVEGALTAEWRQSPAAASAEPGATLLARILRERRARWEASQLAKFKAQGKTPPQGWQAKYPEPVVPETADLPELPEGWAWATMSQVGWLDRGKSKHRPRNAPHLYGGPYPFVQTGDIRHADTFISSAETTYSEAGLAQSRLWPTGTMCITIAANIGKTAILSMEACFPDSVVGFLPATSEVSVRYIEYFMRGIQQRLEDEAPATAQKNINLEILEKIPVPVPSLQEQNRIVEILDELLQAAADKSRAINLALRQSAAQRKNILQTAFSGQLVPQDPSDEPASVLLERIRAERATRLTQPTSHRRVAKKK